MNETILTAVLLGTLTITSYRSVPAQTDDTPCITASGQRVHRYGTAVSREMLKRWGGNINYGDVLYIEDYGFKVVNDTMHPRHKKWVDIWVKTYEEEKAVGARRGKVWLIQTRKKFQKKK